MTNESLVNLGNLFGFGDINLGVFSIPITVFCVVGLMNAYNMIDGLNGICASFALSPTYICDLFWKFFIRTFSTHWSNIRFSRIQSRLSW